MDTFTNSVHCHEHIRCFFKASVASNNSKNKLNHFDFLQSLENDHFYHASKPSHFSNNGRFTDPFLKGTILMWLYTRFLYVFGVLHQNRPFSSIFPFAKWPFLSPSQNLVHFFNTKRPVNSLLRGSFWHVT